MTHSFAIQFPPKAEREARAVPLDIVMSPIDDFTGRVIAGGVTATIPRQGVRAGQSLSGHLVFERLTAEDRHVVHVDPTSAGYFAPEPITIDIPQNRATRIVRLIQRPDAVVDGSAMIVRGGVTRDGEPVDGQVVEGRIAGIATAFRTRSNDRGNFALRLKPPSPPLGTDGLELPITADVTLRFVDAGIPDITVTGVQDMRTRVLETEVQIS